MHSMVSRSSNDKEVAVSVIYGLSGLGLFLISSLFHLLAFWGRPCLLKDIFHKGDRVFIYIFIAASYTPWLVLRDFEFNTGINCMYVIWSAAIFGIAYQLVYHEKHKCLDTTMYLAIGILPGMVLFYMKNPEGLSEVVLSGAVYVSGVVFFKLDGVVPFAHAIWHLFVVVGAVVQFNAVATHLVGRMHDDLGF